MIFASRRFSKGGAGFWWVAGLVLLLPSSSVFPAADLAADRRMYLPMCAFAVVPALFLRNVKAKHLLLPAVLLAALSFSRTRVWLTEKSLWEEAVRLSPNKVRPKIHLARAMEPATAVELLKQAGRLAPEDPRVPSELGRAYMLMGKPRNAVTEFGRTLALAPGNAQALNNRGVALLALGQVDVARQDFQSALEINPCLFDARFNLRRLGVVLPAEPGCRFSDEQRWLLGGE